MTRIAALLAGAAFALGAVGSAHAAVHFTNTSDRPIVLTMRCADSSETYRWVVGVNRTLSVSCLNGAREALVRLYTSRPAGPGVVVSRVVIDGADYNVFFDNDGDANIAPAA
jgi:hypothetical protein